MGLGEHRHVLPLLGISLELVDELLDLGIIDLQERLLDGQGHARVVDVLRGESEMDKLLVGIQSADGVKLLLDEILHGLDVMVGHLLDVLHTGGILLREVAVDAAKTVEEGRVEALELRQGELHERDKVFDFHADAITYQRKL